ncbi:MAG TPA: type IV pilus secretin PilQ [Terriglobales bacterium]|nr:type IV pilus secretin PilQ [Terriglobales bacterium]
MMRAKQLLKILLPLVALTVMAVAAEPQLAEVTAVAQDGASLVTIRATGAFTHTEYRPAENLLLVDLAGVTAGKLEGTERKLQVPGVSGYRVVGYKGSSGAAVVRVELTLAPNAGISLSEETNALLVQVTGAGAAPAKAAAASSSAKDAPKPVAGKSVLIQDVSVVRGQDGMNVEIRGSGPMQSKVMKLTNPDRLVVDVTGTPVGKGREIAVHDAQVKSVRMSHFQKNPAVTRVVVDLESAQDYQLVPEGNKLVLKLHAPANAAPAPAVAETAPAASATAPATPPTKMVAQDFVVIEPKDPTQAKSEPAAEEIRPGERAADAATRFSKPENTLAATNLPQPANASLQPQPTVNLALQQQQQMAQVGGSSMPAKPRYTGEPISLNLKDADLKDFFRLIHEISGLNVVLDPNVKGSITIVLDDVPWDQALDIVLKNNNLERELDGNVLRIATVETLRKEAEGRKAQTEARDLAANKVIITRYLSYARANDLMPIIKKFLTSRGDVVADPRTNALIIQDIPNVLPGVEQRIRDLDLKTPQVEIEARVVSATRNFARDIGTQLGFGWNNRVTSLGGTNNIAAITPTVFNGGPGFLNLGGAGIPLFSNLPVIGPTSALGIATGASQTYRLDFALTMAESRGLLKILSRPRVVTQNNVKAEVKQGVRLPIVTQAQLSGPPTVTYVEAVLRLTVTPQITVENTIFLNIELQNDTADFTNAIQGNPSILTQSETTQVLVTDGGTVVIGGVIQTQNQVSVTQVPLLGDIPVFGNLFKHRKVSTTTQELIFFITPKIIQT